MDAIKIVHESVEAHGGLDYWNSLEALEAEISAGGFLFTAKRRPVLRHVRMRAAAHEPRFSFFDFPKPGQTAELIGKTEVRILDSEGTIIAQRENPRAAFHGLRRLFSWDDLDFTYFGGYATWNYLTAPFLLMRKGFVFKGLEPLPGALAPLTRVEVMFPDDIPTHSRKQIFYFDDQRLIRRLDYTAEVVGGWAHAAHLCEEYRTFGGIKAPTKRRALPLLFGTNPLSKPKLVELEVHHIRPIPNS
ncbi:MAG: hypothetical protein A2V86_06740 [Deltaproteobacteria bacterium RBG_16_49_23]|nr:MAG: hypothetical protein A2V86_06740 [Deltaproteobacteria bacterium RBG_16_49_23]